MYLYAIKKYKRVLIYMYVHVYKGHPSSLVIDAISFPAMEEAMCY